MRDRARGRVVGLLAVLAVSACAGGPTGFPSRSATPTQTPSSSPTLVATLSPSPSPSPSLMATLPHGVFTATGSTTVLSYGAAAAVLDDGEVLVVGSEPGPADIYDPTTGAFHTTGAPVYPGGPDESAVLLANGRVLVMDAGEAEIYDPTTGKFSQRGHSSFDRSGGAIALLKSGQVLVAGGLGMGAAGVLKSAELYDTASGKFIPTGSMKTGRECFTTTVLQSGKVLVAGGDDGSGCSPYQDVFAGAEIYDPQTRKFTPTGSMTTPRQDATATLLDNGKVLIAGGDDENGPLASAELYDPTTGRFTRTGSMTITRNAFTATLLLDGRVLIAGGGDSSAQLYGPASGTFIPTGSMAAATYNPTAVRLNDGRVLVFGGEGPGGGTSAELYWP